ncbi:hypothetical protein L2E82_38756 [Cichorium intybus]|uniref:Uncharacterized protein n=1 Tax=Cichorium intybus TaxID=13427 RepID=A0ACB9AKT0_CICIN|nr:hypothetical protein L2E82_38756 [Cichorium intybus]
MVSPRLDNENNYEELEEVNEVNEVNGNAEIGVSSSYVGPHGNFDHQQKVMGQFTIPDLNDFVAVSGSVKKESKGVIGLQLGNAVDDIPDSSQDTKTSGASSNSSYVEIRKTMEIGSAIGYRMEGMEGLISKIINGEGVMLCSVINELSLGKS